MRWKEFGGKIVPQLQAFDDGWSALASFPDLITAMGKIDNEDISLKDFCALLLRLGFQDMTPRKNPYGPKGKKKATGKKKRAVDHINGDVYDNRPENLRIVKIGKNT